MEPTRPMLRWLIVLHRYVGVVLGVLMTLWCLSGFVMMYQSFPELTPEERLQGLAPLPTGCCDLSRAPIADDARVVEARVEMAAGAPVLRLSVEDQPPALFDATSGRARGGFSDAEVLEIARTFGVGRRIVGAPRDLGFIGIDQWTVQTAKRNRPVHHIAFDDPAGTEIYVSGASGEVFQDTDRRERVLSWFGAIPHWLYPTALRQDGKLWGQVVIWSATLGVFLTVTGLYVGIARVGAVGRFSPYRGLWFWHHMTGLVFGLLTLTWVFSGLLTMNPWGLFESDAGAVRGELAGTVQWADVKRGLAQPRRLPAVQVSAAPLGGEAWFLATDAQSATERFDAGGRSSPAQAGEIKAAIARAGLKIASLERLTAEDAYYYGHHGEVELPAYRAILDDRQATRLYFAESTGRLTRAVDEPARGSRWFQSALHDFDWPYLKRRPVWDLVVLPLLLGVTAVCAIGAWLGVQRIGLDWRALRRRLSRGPR